MWSIRGVHLVVGRSQLLGRVVRFDREPRRAKALLCLVDDLGIAERRPRDVDLHLPDPFAWRALLGKADAADALATFVHVVSFTPIIRSVSKGHLPLRSGSSLSLDLKLGKTAAFLPGRSTFSALTLMFPLEPDIELRHIRIVELKPNG